MNERSPGHPAALVVMPLTWSSREGRGRKERSELGFHLGDGLDIDQEGESDVSRKQEIDPPCLDLGGGFRCENRRRALMMCAPAAFAPKSFHD